jgi:hypothetical protein
MANESILNTPMTEGGQSVESIPPALPGDETTDVSGKSRRDALAILARHTAYTAPAVVAMLSLTTKRANAFSF